MFQNLCRCYGYSGTTVTTVTNVATTMFTLFTEVTQILRSPLLPWLPRYGRVHWLLWLHESATSVALCGHFVSSCSVFLSYLPVFLSQVKTQLSTQLLKFTMYLKQLEVNKFILIFAILNEYCQRQNSSRGPLIAHKRLQQHIMS